jgi:hypothetical protein
MTTHISRCASARMVIVYQRSDVRFARVNPRPVKGPGKMLDRWRSVSAGARGMVAALTARFAPRPDAGAR